SISTFQDACRVEGKQRRTRHTASVAQADERIHSRYMTLAADQRIDVQFRDPVLMVQGEVACPTNDVGEPVQVHCLAAAKAAQQDRKSTRLNSSRVKISYAV